MIIDSVKFIIESDKAYPYLFFSDEMINTVEEKTEKNVPSEKKQRKREKVKADDVSNAVQTKTQGGNCVDLLEFTLE